MNILLKLLSPGIIGIVAVFLSIVWMLRNERDKTRPLLVFALILNLFYGWLLTVALGREDSLLPWKFDLVLFRIDGALGISAASIALPLQGAWRIPLNVVYQLMVPMMVLWFLIVREPGRRKSVILAYIAEMVAGPMLYAILPACGPIYAFGARWLHPQDVEAHAIRFSGMPNAFPSLHVGTAFIFVLTAKGKLWRGVSLLFLLATALATLATGEHFVIDLVAGLVFGCFAMNAGCGRVRLAALFLGIGLLWSLTIRIGYTAMIETPLLVRSMALLTLAIAVWAVWKEWGQARELIMSRALEAAESS